MELNNKKLDQILFLVNENNKRLTKFEEELKNDRAEIIIDLMMRNKKKLIGIEKEIKEIKILLNGNISENCKKMSEHIDFIDNIYDNVKNPLGFLCNKINYFSNNDTNYSLEENKEIKKDI